jgi:hypothetical protein
MLQVVGATMRESRPCFEAKMSMLRGKVSNAFRRFYEGMQIVLPMVAAGASKSKQLSCFHWRAAVL